MKTRTHSHTQCLDHYMSWYSTQPHELTFDAIIVVFKVLEAEGHHVQAISRPIVVRRDTRIFSTYRHTLGCMGPTTKGTTRQDKTR